MKKRDDAVQYSPFDALCGLQKSLKSREKNVLTRRSVKYDDEHRLKQKLMQLQPGAWVCIVYLWQGEYISCSGKIALVCPEKNKVKINERLISFGDIVSIS